MTMIYQLTQDLTNQLANMRHDYHQHLTVTDQAVTDVLLERAQATLHAAAAAPEQGQDQDHMMIKIGSERLLVPTHIGNQLFQLLQTAQRVQDTHWYTRQIDKQASPYMLAADPYPAIETQVVPHGYVEDYQTHEEAHAKYEAHKANAATTQAA